MQQPALSTSASSGIPVGLRSKPAVDASTAKDHAAGIMFVAPDGDVLLLRRSSTEPNYGGHWALPGGNVEEGETPDQGAAREAQEEMGGSMEGRRLKLLDRRITPTGMAFHTFAHPVEKKFQPKLNGEHSGFTWSPLGDLPRPLHPGVESTLKDRLGTTDDMKPEDWAGLRDGFLKFLDEEEAEPDHAEADDAASGKLNEKERAEADKGEKDREEMPASAFLEPAERKYPVKAKVDGEWKYTHNLLLAAARRARLEKDESLAKRADEIRAKEFGAEDLAAIDSALALALDKDSVREIDKDGRLHVEVANICKAGVSDYLGKEIPKHDEMGLQPDRIYKVYRPAEEIEKATDTANGIQILQRHIPVDADDHQPYDIIGSTGSDAKFENPYLKNSLHFWTQKAIDNIESGDRRQLSPGYHYDPVLENGTFDGEDYQIKMTNIVFNHIAAVETGRQGKDVTVGDSIENLQWALIERELEKFMEPN